MELIMRLCVRSIGHECFIYLKNWIYKVRWSVHDDFNHAPVCPKKSAMYLMGKKNGISNFLAKD